MNIAILTLPLGQNYGGILQNYALQQMLLRLGHTPTTLALPFPVKKRSPQQSANGDDRNRELLRFLRERIRMSAPLQCPLDKSQIHQYGFEGYVVGSDQIWRPSFGLSDFFKAMFLTFLPKDDPSIRLAYAASFGQTKWTLPRRWLYRLCYGPAARRFHGISVREDAGVEYCQKYLRTPAKVVLDPVLMLDGEDYKKSLELSTDNTGGICSYILDPTPNKTAIINQLQQKLAISSHISYSDLGHTTNQMPSLESWMAAIANSAFVVTDSFHGTVLSILFRRPFITIGNPSRGMERFTSLLGQLGLQAHLIMPDATLDQVPEAVLALPNYEQVMARLQELRSHSMEFLQEYL